MCHICQIFNFFMIAFIVFLFVASRSWHALIYLSADFYLTLWSKSSENKSLARFKLGRPLAHLARLESFQCHEQWSNRVEESTVSKSKDSASGEKPGQDQVLHFLTFTEFCTLNLPPRVILSIPEVSEGEHWLKTLLNKARLLMLYFWKWQLSHQNQLLSRLLL